jgi:thymidylate kinase
VTDSAVIVHLIGFPGAGKYTVAGAIARQAELDGRRYVVIDNHHTSNVIFKVMDVDGVRPIPREVWDRVGEVRAVLCRAIEEFSPPDWSFVFTNVLTEGEQVDRDIVARLSELAVRRGNPYVPIYIRCETEENLRRVPAVERRERMKWIDADAVRAFVDGHELLRFDGHDPFAVDVTSLTPDDAARQILDHIADL